MPKLLPLALLVTLSSGVVNSEALPDTFRDCEACPLMASLPGGAFVMGHQGDGNNPYEVPSREVTIAPFAIGVHEVTYAQWDACVADGACSHSPDDERFGRGARPVMNVRIADIDEFLGWLEQKTGKPYRLPSEAEWEYAARGGTKTRFWWGDEASPEQANYNGFTIGGPAKAYRRSTVETGSLPANPFGLHEILGNVHEWVADCWHASYEGAPKDGSPWMEGGRCDARPIRGGAWTHRAPDARVSYRWGAPVTRRGANLGFRVARDLGAEGVDKAVAD